MITMMNRILAAAAIACGLTTGAMAQSTGESYAQAQAIFGQAPETLWEDIDGEWLPMSLLAGGIDAPVDEGMIATFTDRFCGTERGGRIIEARAAGFTMTYTKPNGDTLAEWYDWFGGERYRYNVDPESYAHNVGLAGDGAAQADRLAQVWGQLPVVVNVYRPVDDVLVVVPDRGSTLILVRCP
jgi:hypothetical protein